VLGRRLRAELGIAQDHHARAFTVAAASVSNAVTEPGLAL
jgi:hypothetical protein